MKSDKRGMEGNEPGGSERRIDRPNPQEIYLFGGKPAFAGGLRARSIDRRGNQDKNGGSREIEIF